MIIVIIIRLIGNCLISFKSSKGSSIYLSPYSFQSLSLIISITANNFLINNNRKIDTLRRRARKFAVYKNSAQRTGRSFRHLNCSKSLIYISFPVRYFRKTSEESSVRNREDIIALNRRRLSFASSQNFIFSLSVGAMLRTSQRAPSPMLKLVVIFRVARKFDCTVFVKRTTPLFCLILR